jgi:dipeptidyl aminopeptidase/acylaminoacyl peptidase
MGGFDAERVIIHPTRQVIETLAFEPGRREWSITDPEIAADFEALAGLDDGDFQVVSRDLDDRNWIVVFEAPHRPVRYFLWERPEKKASFFFSNRPELERVRLAEVLSIKYRARDGMELHGYLAIPPGLESRNLPLVLGVHGGPWARDYWTLNTWTQYIASRG